MKKIVIILVLIISIVLFGCNKETSEEIDKNIIDMVTNVETLDHSFSNINMTFEDYIIGLKGMFIDNYKEDDHYDRIYFKDTNDFKLKDITREQIDRYKESRKEPIDITIKISKVYTDEKTGLKYVFTESIFDSDNKDITSYLRKRYILINIDNSWKIRGIEKAWYGQKDIENREDLLFDKFYGEKVKYPYDINILE